MSIDQEMNAKIAQFQGICVAADLGLDICCFSLRDEGFTIEDDTHFEIDRSDRHGRFSMTSLGKVITAYGEIFAGGEAPSVTFRNDVMDFAFIEPMLDASSVVLDGGFECGASGTGAGGPLIGIRDN